MPGASLRFDLQQGFPAVTTKKLAFKSAIGELVGFLRATRSAAEFRELGCKVWDQNANENAQWLANPYREGPDDLGPVYGVQWRQWPAYRCSTPVVRRRSPTPWRAAMQGRGPGRRRRSQGAALQGRRPAAPVPGHDP